MDKSKVFLVLSLGFVGGIFCGSFWNALFQYAFIFLITSIIISLVFYRQKRMVLGGILILFFVFGLWRAEEFLEKFRGDLDGQTVSGKSYVAKEPEEKNGFKQAVIKNENEELFLVSIPLNSGIEYGDRLDYQCVLELPRNKDEFDYRMYLAKEEISYLCKNPRLEKTGGNSGNYIYRSVLGFKNRIEENINQTIPQPEAALANGLIIGGNGRMTKDMQENFSRTGMSHIVAVSGFNVTIIAEYLMLFGIFIGLWRRQAFWFAVVGIILFVAMTGFPSSAVRAGVMGTLLLWAMKNGRLVNSWNAIIFSAALMLAINPLLLRWDIGFQLSFLATAGIVALSPLAEKYVLKKYRTLGLMEIILLTIAAQIFALPIIVYNFHTFSLVSLLANLLVLPVIPLAMLLIFLVGISGFISSSLALVFSWLAFLFLKYITSAVSYLSSFRWASMETGELRWEYLFLWYLALGILLVYIKKKQRINFSRRVATSEQEEIF